MKELVLTNENYLFAERQKVTEGDGYMHRNSVGGITQIKEMFEVSSMKM